MVIELFIMILRFDLVLKWGAGCRVLPPSLLLRLYESCKHCLNLLRGHRNRFNLGLVVPIQAALIEVEAELAEQLTLLLRGFRVGREDEAVNGTKTKRGRHTKNPYLKLIDRPSGRCEH